MGNSEWRRAAESRPRAHGGAGMSVGALCMRCWAGSKRSVRQRKSKVVPGQRLMPRPFSLTYQLLQPSAVHTAPPSSGYPYEAYDIVLQQNSTDTHHEQQTRHKLESTAWWKNADPANNTHSDEPVS